MERAVFEVRHAPRRAVTKRQPNATGSPAQKKIPRTDPRDEVMGSTEVEGNGNGVGVRLRGGEGRSRTQELVATAQAARRSGASQRT